MNQHDERHYKFGRTDPWPDYPLDDAKDDSGAIDAFIVIVSIVIALWLIFGAPDAAAEEEESLHDVIHRIQERDRQDARDYEQYLFQRDTTERLKRMERDAEFRDMTERSRLFLLQHQMRQKQ